MGAIFDKNSFILGVILDVLKNFFSRVEEEIKFPWEHPYPNISDQHLLRIKNYSVHNASIMSLLDLLEYRRPPSSEGIQGLQTFATINSRIFPKQASV